MREPFCGRFGPPAVLYFSRASQTAPDRADFSNAIGRLLPLHGR